MFTDTFVHIYIYTHVDFSELWERGEVLLASVSEPTLYVQLEKFPGMYIYVRPPRMHMRHTPLGLVQLWTIHTCTSTPNAHASQRMLT